MKMMLNPNYKPTKEDREMMDRMVLDTPEKKAAHRATFEANVKEWEGMTPAQQQARLAEGRAKMEARRAGGETLIKYNGGSGADFECPPGAKCANPGGNVPQGNAYGLIHQALRNSAQVVQGSMNQLKGVGITGLTERSKEASQQSLMSRLLDGPMIDPDDDLPTGPGTAYLTHLFRSTGAADKLKQKQKDAATKGLGIMTNAMDGVRTALKMIGMADDRNIDGLPIDMQDVLKIFHGDEADKLDDIKKTEFLREIGDGATKIDRKKIRKFVNQDGSLTWEILNDDKKTIMSRFTFGEYNGKKLFAQGGYKQFGELLREARQKLGPDHRAEFDSIRSRYGR